MPENQNDTIQKLDVKIAQLQARKKSLESKEKAKLKRERTARLIKYGELVEKYLGQKNIEEIERILSSIKS